MNASPPALVENRAGDENVRCESRRYVLHLMIFYPITSDFSAWYAADYVLAVIVGLGLVVVGFYASLAGEPLFRGAIPDE